MTATDPLTLAPFDSSIPEKWLDEYGELDMDAVTKDVHRLRAQTLSHMVSTVGHSVKSALHLNGQTAHSETLHS